MPEGKIMPKYLKKIIGRIREYAQIPEGEEREVITRSLDVRFGCANRIADESSGKVGNEKLKWGERSYRVRSSEKIG